MPHDLLQKEPTFAWQRALLKANPKAQNLFQIEQIAFWYGSPMGRFYHMRRLADFLFSQEHNPNIIKPLVWNPWSVWIARVLCDGDPSLSFRGRPHNVGLTGPASSSKTFTVSLYIFLCWYCNPLQTKAVASSTSIQAAKNKIWAEILFFATSVLPDLQFYVTLTSNPAIIKLPKGTPGATDIASIELIAGDDSQAEASAKVLGIKNKFFLLGVDESTEVSHALLAAQGNVSKNVDYQMIFIGNAAEHDDPHGKMCEPKDGWDSISVESEMWETIQPKGVCLHLDGRKSPNMGIPEGQPLPYPGIFSEKDLVGEVGSVDDMRFNRGFWAKGGAVEQIYSQQLIEIYKAQEKPMWREAPKRVMGHDPAFSTDGDAAKAVICDIGELPDGFPVIAHVGTVSIEVDDTRTKDRSYAMAERLAEVAAEYNIKNLSDIGVDCTGTGVSYPEIVDAVFNKLLWGGHCTRVPFNGSPSDIPYPNDDLTEPGKMFDRRVSELWYIGRLFLQKGQLRGLKDSLVKQMCQRRYERIKQKMICVETKRAMRERRTGSPDEADSFFIALDLARSKYGFAVSDKPHGEAFTQVSPWSQVQQRKRTFKEWSDHYLSFSQGRMLTPERHEGGWMGKHLK